MRILLFVLLSMIVCVAARAQHVRVYAVVLANDSAGASLAASSEGCGLYQSDDTGRTWIHLGWNNGKAYSMDMIEASNGRILYLATGQGVLRSMDYGSTWRQLTGWRISEVTDIAINQLHAREMSIATAHGMWKTNDSGNTWQPDTVGMTTPMTYRVAYDRTDFSRLLAANEDGAYSRREGKILWTRITGSPKACRSVIQSRDLNWIFLSDSGAYSAERSVEKYINWKKLSSAPAWAFAEAGDRLDQNVLQSDRKLFGGPQGTSELTGAGLRTDSSARVANTSALSIIGMSTLTGTLGEGVWKDANGVHTLPKRQIWTLKTFLVE
jgi:hypothetical protein